MRNGHSWLRFVRLALLVAVLLSVADLFGVAPLPPTPATAATVQATPPTTMVGDGVTRYTLAASKLFWHTGVLPCPPSLATVQAVPTANEIERISRIASYGSPVRELYAQEQPCSGNEVLSNIVADANFVYWLGADGLMKLSVEANVGDAPQIVTNAMTGYGEVALGSDKVYVLKSTASNTKIWSVDKATGANDPILNTSDGYGNALSYDGQYVYFITNGSLRRLTIGVSTVGIANGVSGYYAEGARSYICGVSPIKFCTSRNVYIGIGNRIFRYDSTTGVLGDSPIYTSSDATAQVYSLTTSGGFIGGNLLFFERRQAVTGGFSPYTHVLLRTGRGGGAADPIYTSDISFFTGPMNLVNDNTYLFWEEGGAIERLPINAEAIPQVNMRVTGVEVTQGIQSLNNTVLLVKSRRTFVRVYVRSDGAAIPNVGAQLSNPASPFNPLQPVNSVGTRITVRPTPSRNDLNQSFLFELPWNWTTQNNLTLNVNLNPYKVPLEPNYGDNASNITVQFKNSPTLSAEFFRLNYRVGNTDYRPRINKDVLQTYSWIMRAYPIGGAIGQNFKPRLWDVAGDTKLGNWVTQSSSDCNDKGNLCASYYTNGWLKYYRDHGWVPNTNNFYYGMIADGAAFPRGQAIYAKTSVGPSGTGNWGWDFDGSYADWYAGHEIGHSLGRPHPSSGSDNPATEASENCGHSRSGDLSYEHGNLTSSRAPIGPADNSVAGFDVGDPAFNIARAVYPSTTWNDVMSYCANQWISDYTYTRMYNSMIANPSLLLQTASVKVNGDFLSASGIINPANSTASFALLRRIPTATSAPVAGTGDYTLRQLDTANNVLASKDFAVEESDEGEGLTFDTLVNVAPGVRSVQLVRKSDNRVLVTQAISANAPVISNVALQGASNPVTGTITLDWTASDPDGDALQFDIFYSRDNGTTFQPVKMGVTGNSTTIDTATLGGSGTAILRVAASDGVNTAEAASAPFTMANKPPQPYILSPGDNTRIFYGQLVNFNGTAFDAQDNIVTDGGLVWTTDKGVTLGTGALVSSDTLPVGINKITLTATNSAGEKASTTITVIVSDDLTPLGPTLSVGPGQLGWHIGSGEAAQTADLTITNVGGGSLDWTASSNQPWLTTNVLSGTVTADGDASTLTVTANPVGLAADSVYTATLTITKPAVGDAEPAQTVVIPVSLSIGDIWDLPARNQPQQPLSRKVYLPITTR